MDPAPQLIAIVALLETFNRRNRNQHRRSAWWQHFSILRRSLRKLTGSSRTRPHPHHPFSNPEARAQWVAGHVITSSYIVFSQLAADNQFAHLGLFLLALLAQIRLAVSPFRPMPPGPNRPKPPSTTPHPPASRSCSSSTTKEKPSVNKTVSVEADADPETETGVVVPRTRGNSSVVAPIAAGPGPEQQSRSQQKHAHARPDRTEKAPTKKRRLKAKSGTDLGHLFGGL